MSSDTPSNYQTRTSDNQVQGEGDYNSNRSDVKSAESFVESGEVDDVARKEKPESAQQAEALQSAEKEGASHAKGDPAHNAALAGGNRR